MADCNDEFMQCTPPEVAKLAEQAVSNLMPTKSSTIYENVYEKFIKWCGERNINSFSENILLAYFSELDTKMKMKSSTLWSYYSMIRTTLNIKHGIDISKYLKLRAFLKKKNEGYCPKKSRVFTKEQFDRFLSDAPDEKYLGAKVTFRCNISRIK